MAVGYRGGRGAVKRPDDKSTNAPAPWSGRRALVLSRYGDLWLAVALTAGLLAAGRLGAALPLRSALPLIRHASPPRVVGAVYAAARRPATPPSTLGAAGFCTGRVTE